MLAGRHAVTQADMPISISRRSPHTEDMLIQKLMIILKILKSENSDNSERDKYAHPNIGF